MLDALLARLLALPAVDRALGAALARPRLTQLVAVLIGLLCVGMSLEPLLQDSPATHTPTARQAATAATASRHPLSVGFQRPAATPSTIGPSEQAVLAMVADYNQASIRAGSTGTAEPMRPYLAADGAAWKAVQGEYLRRLGTGELHQATLTRWGIIAITISADRAEVQTQEQWDDQTMIDGTLVASTRGLLARNTYTLRRQPGSSSVWLITDVVTQVMIT